MGDGESHESEALCAFRIREGSRSRAREICAYGPDGRVFLEARVRRRGLARQAGWVDHRYRGKSGAKRFRIQEIQTSIGNCSLRARTRISRAAQDPVQTGSIGLGLRMRAGSQTRQHYVFRSDLWSLGLRRHGGDKPRSSDGLAERSRPHVPLRQCQIGRDGTSRGVPYPGLLCHVAVSDQGTRSGLRIGDIARFATYDEAA